LLIEAPDFSRVSAAQVQIERQVGQRLGLIVAIQTGITCLFYSLKA